MLILIRGVSGSGKSTLANILAKANKNAIAIAADDYFMENGEYKFDHNRLHEVHFKCFTDAIARLGVGMTVIVHNTFTRHKEMKPYIEAAGRLNIPVQIITVEGTFQNVHGVPPEVIAKQKARFEK